MAIRIGSNSPRIPAAKLLVPITKMAIAVLVMGTSSFAAGILGELLPIRIAIAVIGATSGVTAVVFLFATMGIRRRLRSEMQQQSDSTRAYL